MLTPCRIDFLEWRIPEPVVTEAPVWTIQRFTDAHAWFALHKQTDAGVTHGIAGPRRHLDAWCRTNGVTPEELPAISEADYFAVLRCVTNPRKHTMHKHITPGSFDKWAYKLGLKFSLALMDEDASIVKMPVG